MAQFLATNGNTYLAEGMLISAESFLYIFSPYFKLNDWLIEKLDNASRRSVDVYIISNNWMEEDLLLLEGLGSIACFQLEGLKATCILDSQMALFTSLNISEWGNEGDKHAGVLVEASQDIALYRTMKQEMLANLNIAQSITSIQENTDDQLVLA